MTSTILPKRRGWGNLQGPYQAPSAYLRRRGRPANWRRLLRASHPQFHRKSLAPLGFSAALLLTRFSALLLGRAHRYSSWLDHRRRRLTLKPRDMAEGVGNDARG